MDDVVGIIALAQLGALEHHLLISAGPAFAAEWVPDAALPAARVLRRFPEMVQVPDATAFGGSRCE